MKERFQNPTCNDSLKLRLFTYNANSPKNLKNISKVEIYFLDPIEKSEANPDGRRLIETIDNDVIENVETGEYNLTLTLTSPTYTIGEYLDVWYLDFEEGDCLATVENNFKIRPNLWLTTPFPPIYDFSFNFKPNKIPSGTKRYIIVQVTPNVPRGSDLCKYYENLAITGELFINMQIVCGDCLPESEDLRMVVEDESVSLRERSYGYYFIDTTDLALGTYDVWFKLNFGESVFISPKQQLQIF
jgi:hypothetical protein